FFSSRRRHTRSKRDWSSDVCSSDLVEVPPELRRQLAEIEKDGGSVVALLGESKLLAYITMADTVRKSAKRTVNRLKAAGITPVKIGRASCRERGAGEEGAR